MSEIFPEDFKCLDIVVTHGYKRCVHIKQGNVSTNEVKTKKHTLTGKIIDSVFRDKNKNVEHEISKVHIKAE